MSKAWRYAKPCPSIRPHLSPTTPEEVADALAFALRFSGPKRINHAGEFMAQITAQRLIEHLRQSGFVVMKKRAAEMAASKAKG